MNKERIKYELGRLKTWYNRITVYTTIFNFVMLLYLYLKENPMGLAWYIWVVLLGTSTCAILFFDVVMIYPSESAYSFRKNPEWNKLRLDVEEIKKILQGKNVE